MSIFSFSQAIWFISYAGTWPKGFVVIKHMVLIISYQLGVQPVKGQHAKTINNKGCDDKHDLSCDAWCSSITTVSLVCWTRSHRARLGSHNHQNYTHYISFLIVQQDFRVSRLSFSLCLSHWLWSGGTDVRGRGVAMEMGATVAFQEDGSWQNEAEHQRQLRIRQVK